MGPKKAKQILSVKDSNVSSIKLRKRKMSQTEENKDEVNTHENETKLQTISNDKEKHKLFKNILSPPIIVKQQHNSVININNFAYGNISVSNYTNFRKRIIKERLTEFRVHEVLCPFERRVTAIEWHPLYSNVFVSGSKGGELNLHRLADTEDFFRPGVGAGGSVVGLKFCLEEPCSVYTVSITGLLRKEDFHGVHSKNLLSTLSWQYWFSCLDICHKRKFLLSGDSNGHMYLLKTSGEKIWEHKPKLHKSKITHCEFNKHDENIFVTASVDHTVKLWDIRMVGDTSEKLQPLIQLVHEKGVNSAYFSASNGLNLLTTDQDCQLRIYSSPGWTEHLVIKHPHRKFQHLTPIQANWHPMEDIVIVGRYPDDKFLVADTRTVDFFDASSGKLLYKIPSPSGNITSLCAMNISADTLACAAGYNVTFLKSANVLDEISRPPNIDDDDDINNIDTPPKSPPKPKRKPTEGHKNNKPATSKKTTKKVAEMF